MFSRLDSCQDTNTHIVATSRLTHVILGLFTTWASGSAVTKSFEASASLSAKYLGFSGAVSGSYSTENDFSEDRQYAMFDYTQTMLQASLIDYGDNVNLDILRQEMKNVGPFDSSKVKSVQSYRDLFRTLGSHIVVGTTYGGRLTLVSTQSS